MGEGKVKFVVFCVDILIFGANLFLLYGYLVDVVHLNDIKMKMTNRKRSIDNLSRADYSIEAKQTFFFGNGKYLSSSLNRID